MREQELQYLLENLIKQPNESEWVEFKLNFHSAEEIGERISALSNGANLLNQQFGYLSFGVKDKVHTVEGTSFKPRETKKGNDELENWLAQRLNPRVDFRIYEFQYKEKNIVIFEIPATSYQPVRFFHEAYIRIGSITRKLNDFPEKEAKIWNKKTAKAFEREILYFKRKMIQN